MPKPIRVGHLVLNVKDQVASTKFYTKCWDSKFPSTAPVSGPS